MADLLLTNIDDLELSALKRAILEKNAYDLMHFDENATIATLGLDIIEVTRLFQEAVRIAYGGTCSADHHAGTNFCSNCGLPLHRNGGTL